MPFTKYTPNQLIWNVHDLPRPLPSGRSASNIFNVDLNTGDGREYSKFVLSIVRSPGNISTALSFQLFCSGWCSWRIYRDLDFRWCIRFLYPLITHWELLLQSSLSQKAVRWQNRYPQMDRTSLCLFVHDLLYRCFLYCRYGPWTWP